MQICYAESTLIAAPKPVRILVPLPPESKRNSFSECEIDQASDILAKSIFATRCPMEHPIVICVTRVHKLIQTGLPIGAGESRDHSGEMLCPAASYTSLSKEHGDPAVRQVVSSRSG